MLFQEATRAETAAAGRSASPRVPDVRAWMTSCAPRLRAPARGAPAASGGS